MTYLEVVNSILRRLREDTVSSVTENEYSTLIGDLVNTVKSEVEDAWKWNALRSTITVNTIASTYRYVLTDAGTKSSLLDSYNNTSDWQLRVASSPWLNQQFTYADPQTGEPTYYGVNGADSSGDIQVDVYPIPDAVYVLDFNLILKQAELSADADVPLVPSDVLVLGAWALAVSERGEDGGAGFAELDGKYRQALSDAIAIDGSNMHDSELCWGVE